MYYSIYDERRDAYVRGEANYDTLYEAIERRDAIRTARKHKRIHVYAHKDFIKGLIIK